MPLLAVGLNHNTAPVAIREQVAFAPEQLRDALQHLYQQHAEVVVLSTCNRTEIYLNSSELEVEVLLAWLQQFHGLSHSLVDYCYHYQQQQVVAHLYRVACGLDSLVLGEPQILGQLKQAFARAQEANTVGTVLQRLFQHAFTVAKAVRSQTQIGANAVSVAYAAVSLAKHIFTDMSQLTVLLIGAGETIELAAKHLYEQGVSTILVANRTVARALKVAEPLGGQTLALESIPDYLPQADIVVASTASPLPILGKGLVERALKRRKHRPVFMVDLAVPRDIEAEVADLADVYLYTVDDLRDVIEENRKARLDAAHQAEQIVESRSLEFMQWLKSLDAVATIRALREHAQSLKQQHLSKALRDLQQGQAAPEVIERFAHGLLNQLLHQPTTQLREASALGHTETVDAAQQLFGLTISTEEKSDNESLDT